MPFNEKDIGAIDINVRKAKVGDKEAFKKLIEENFPNLKGKVKI